MLKLIVNKKRIYKKSSKPQPALKVIYSESESLRALRLNIKRNIDLQKRIDDKRQTRNYIVSP